MRPALVSSKMGVVLNKARHMVLKTCSKKTHTSEVLALKTPLRDIKIELAVRRAKLWLSLKKLQNDECITQRRKKTYSKDWMRALKFDLERLGVKDIEEWIRNPSKVDYSLNVNTQVKSVGTREQIVACEIGNCARHCATIKEMRRHLRNDHSESGEGLDMTPFQANKPTNASMVCPATDCKMTYKQIRWWLDHTEKAHPQCTIVESDNVTEELTAEPQSTELSGNTLRQQEYEAEFQFPLCPRPYSLIKSVQNYCSTKHRWSYTKNFPIGEKGTRSLMDRSTSNPYVEAPHCGSSNTPLAGVILLDLCQPRRSGD